MDSSLKKDYLTMQSGATAINFHLWGRVELKQGEPGRQQEVKVKQVADGWECWLEVKDRGRLSKIELLKGIRTRGEPLKIFSPEPNHAVHHYFDETDKVKIDFNYNSAYWGGDGYFTPAPFFFALKLGEEWIGLGVCAAKNDFQFLSYQYQGGRQGFRLTLNYEPQGYKVKGDWQPPRIFINSGTDEWQVMEKYIAHLRTGYIALPAKDNYEWWHGPLFCGWGEQFYRAKSQGKKPEELARQDQYQEFSRILDKVSFQPSAIIIDDKWQRHYGDFKEDPQKWPDLPGYVEHEHSKGRRVLLWIPLWRIEGLDRQECILTSQGDPICPDPMAEKYKKRIEQGVQYLLGGEGINADGFKIDFSGAFYPQPDMVWAKNIWGTELLRQYLAQIYHAAKAIKPDSLIITQTPNPCFWEITDMLRLNDMPTGLASIIEPMEMRARIAKIACPGFLIDTDNWPIPSKQEWFSYAGKQREWGVVSIYYLTGIDTTGEKISPEDWEKMLNLLKEEG